MIPTKLSRNELRTTTERRKRPVSRGSRLTFAVGLILFGISSLTLHAEEIRHHEAHEHGVAQLNVAVEDNNLYIELHSPAANIVGFEHDPRTQAQKKAVDAATAQLASAEGLFLFPPQARCRLVAADVATDIGGSAESDAHADDETDASQDGHHHDDHHGATEAHDENHSAHAHEDERHSEYQATYQFLCDDPKALTHMAVGLFERFPAIERIAVQQLVGSRQGATELTATKNRLSFE